MFRHLVGTALTLYLGLLIYSSWNLMVLPTVCFAVIATELGWVYQSLEPRRPA